MTWLQTSCKQTYISPNKPWLVFFLGGGVNRARSTKVPRMYADHVFKWVHSVYPRLKVCMVRHWCKHVFLSGVLLLCSNTTSLSLWLAHSYYIYYKLILVLSVQVLDLLRISLAAGRRCLQKILISPKLCKSYLDTIQWRHLMFLTLCFLMWEDALFKQLGLMLWLCNRMPSGMRPQLDFILSQAAPRHLSGKNHRDDCGGKSPARCWQMLAVVI